MLIQSTPAYELSADIIPTPYGHNLKLISFVPSARRPEEQVKFQGLFSSAELTALRDCINRALDVVQPSSSGEPVSNADDVRPGHPVQPRHGAHRLTHQESLCAALATFCCRRQSHSSSRRGGATLPITACALPLMVTCCTTTV